jgi:DNA phosphorothioation-associated putative methyltransferase
MCCAVGRCVVPWLNPPNPPPSDTTYFDYGCGHGADIEYIQRLGLTSAGWDPHFPPDVPQTPADVVNLGYVINVIEDTAERREALINAWNLAQKVLIVAAQVLIDDRTRGVIAYGDGIITSRNTFQKYYEQEELKPTSTRC